MNQVGRVLFIGRGINDDWRDITGDVVVIDYLSVNGIEQYVTELKDELNYL